MVSQQRDSYASYIGHPGLLDYIAVAENESRERVRLNLIKKALQPCGPPPEKAED